MSRASAALEVPGWAQLRHGGLLLDPQRLSAVARFAPAPLDWYVERELRRRAGNLFEGAADPAELAAFVPEQVCGFDAHSGAWLRGSSIGAEWGRRALTGETVKPRQLWSGAEGGTLPVFVDAEHRLGVGRGRKTASQVVQWLRGGDERLALLTNGRQWRLIFAGLDIDAWCEWDADLWLEEGELSPQVDALRTLIQPVLWTPPADGGRAPLEQAILDSRKGQAELSAVLGERVREAVELLVQGHGEALREHAADVDPADIYRAAVRVVMRMVVVLFAESRELLPRDNALYHGSYGLGGLIEELEKAAARGGARLARSYAAWPRVLALFALVYEGSSHPALPVPAYGGELFAPGDPEAADGLTRALAVFERACFARELLPDRDVHRMLELITRTRVKLRQGRASTWVAAPVDFSDLSSEYIGILYEGLLDFELKTAPAGDPVIFLAMGDQPALPLSRLEAMDDRALASLLEKMKDTSKGGDEAEAEEEAPEAEGEDDDDANDEAVEVDETEVEDSVDERHTTRTRAEVWARRAVLAGKLVKALRGAPTPEKRLAHEAAVARKARQLVARVVLPGEWYVVRWGGTRKGSGTFYTRPGLAVPTVQRTLRPLAYDAPAGVDGAPDRDAPASAWAPKPPEDILALKVCDPACGSGTFPVAALRYLTEALYESLHHHERITEQGERALVHLVAPSPDEQEPEERLGHDLLPCRPDDDTFEPRLKALLRRHVVERCIYGVDLDPLAVELCRLSLWIETMDRELPFSFLDHKVKCGNSLVGAWFDTFRHYPVMAFKNREGGDKGHSNGVHFAKDARGKAIKAFVKDVLTPDLRRLLGGPSLFDERDLSAEAASVHDGALATLARLHDLPVQDAGERARIYRDELLGSPAYRQLKEAMDLWCACWFWPADELEQAPLPTTLAAPPEPTRDLAERLAAEKRFFHWELEFPDVFRAPGAGFDAVLGNPPWETLQPNPEEYFSNVDPMFRTYGRLAKNRRLSEMFTDDRDFENAWLDYSAGFNSMSNWVSHSANPFGDPSEPGGGGERFALARGKESGVLHDRWREARAASRGYGDPRHAFRHQTGRIFTYRLFLEQCHALLRVGGRMGQIIPSGVYSDAWSQPLRELFLDSCSWEWLFGFENRDGIFDIHRSFKFNPVVVEKGGRTATIQTAFMRRALEDWERAEELAVPYSREQVERFSPHSLAILEIQSARDLEILEKIYADSVLLGDDGPDGWGVKFKLEFMMNTSANLFPPRPQWEEQGYRPDEYSRWLKGDWRPIEELWRDLGVDPERVVPADVELEDWFFDAGAGPERRTAEARFALGHLLKPGDVARTEWRLRCAQPPYDVLPVPRADIPAGIILSREADAWIREERVGDVALPLYEGKTIWLNEWVTGDAAIDVSGVRSLLPHYLIAASSWPQDDVDERARVVFRDISNATNERSFITTLIPRLPCGNPVPVLELPPERIGAARALLVSYCSSLVFDWSVRQRMSGTHLNWHIVESLAVPAPSRDHPLLRTAAHLNMASRLFSSDWLRWSGSSRECVRGLTDAERRRLRIVVDATCAALLGVESLELSELLNGCDLPVGRVTGPTKGFWRVDKAKDPELRHTVLALVAFHDLEEEIRACGGDRDAGIEAFLGQNDGEGWMLPDMLRIADYGLGYDERAKHSQPVASRLGPRFYDWQLAQGAEESWRECHLHARNLLGERGYLALLDEVAPREPAEQPSGTERPPASRIDGGSQGTLWT